MVPNVLLRMKHCHSSQCCSIKRRMAVLYLCRCSLFPNRCSRLLSFSLFVLPVAGFSLLYDTETCLIFWKKQDEDRGIWPRLRVTSMQSKRIAKQKWVNCHGLNWFQGQWHYMYVYCVCTHIHIHVCVYCCDTFKKNLEKGKTKSLFPSKV